MGKGVAKKRIIEEVHGWHGTIFKVEKDPKSRSQKDILVHFGHPVRYHVVKLGLENLPAVDSQGKRIVWFNNFGVVDSRGRFVKRVKYTVFLPALRRGAAFICYEDGVLNDRKRPRRKGSRWPRPHMVQVDFTTGDPAVGCH